MENLFFQYLLPLLALITTVLIFVAGKAIHFASLHKEESKKQEERYGYTQQAITNVDSNVKVLHEKLDNTVLPNIKAVYDEIKLNHSLLSVDRLHALLVGIGYDKAHIFEGENLVLIGRDTGEIKVTVLLKIDLQRDALHLYSFAFFLRKPSNVFLLRLLKHNHDTEVGTIGFSQKDDKFIITVDDYIYMAESTLTREILERRIDVLIDMHKNINNFIKEYGLEKEELLMHDYIKLANNSEQKESEESRSKIVGGIDQKESEINS